MADIFSEVDEGLRQDRAADLWKKWGPFVIGAAVLLVAAVGVWEYLKYSRAQSIEAVAQDYMAAMDSLEADNFEQAETQFAQIAEGDGGFATIAGHMAAAAAQNQGDREAAIQRLQQVSAGTDNVYSDLAILKSAYMQADELPIAELESLLGPLLTGAGPADALARELIAAKALAEGDVERARRDYQTLSFRLDDGNRLPEFQQRIQRAMLALPPATEAPATEASEVIEQTDDSDVVENQETPAQ